MAETWTAVDTLKLTVRSERENATSAARVAEQHRLAINLVWRQLRRLPAELATDFVLAHYAAKLAPNPSFQSPRASSRLTETLVAADWLREHGIDWKTPLLKPPPIEWRPMTDAESTLVARLGHCRVGSGFDKRFVRSIVDQGTKISARQADILPRLAHRYRRQLASLPVEVADGG
ncbi:MAG: hypothetical protein AAB721_02950 [Patescibacteria group bacterium]